MPEEHPQHSLSHTVIQAHTSAPLHTYTCTHTLPRGQGPGALTVEPHVRGKGERGKGEEGGGGGERWMRSAHTCGLFSTSSARRVHGPDPG
jgi:hypothetical protein